MMRALRTPSMSSSARRISMPSVSRRGASSMRRVTFQSRPTSRSFSTARPLRSEETSAPYTQTPLLNFSEEENMLRDTVSKFAKETIQPKVAEMDRDAKLDEGIKKSLFEQGLMGIEIPSKYGGSGLNFLNSIIVIEELAKIDPAVAVVVDVQNTLVNTIFNKFASEHLKSKYMPRLAADTIGAFCLSEATAGSDAFALKTTAKLVKDHYVLNGTKAWITNAAEAGIFLVMANVKPELGYKGITCFVVEKENPGIKVGKHEDKLGIRASSTCEVNLEECAVPKDAVLGEIGKGYKIAMETLNEGRIGIASQMIGLSQGAFDYAMPYLSQRVQFGKPVIDFQGMQFAIANTETKIQAARLMVYEATRMKLNGQKFTKEAAMAKLFSSEVACETATNVIEWMGAVGFMKDFAAEKYYRDSIVGKIYEGTSNICRQTIAKETRSKYQ